MHDFLYLPAADPEAAVRVLLDNHRWPTFKASIKFSDEGERLSCEVKEDGELVCRMRGRKIPTRRRGMVSVFVYTPELPQPRRADINPEETAAAREPGMAELTLGPSHPLTAELSATLESTCTRLCNYGPRRQFILHGP